MTGSQSLISLDELDYDDWYDVGVELIEISDGLFIQDFYLGGDCE